MQLNDGRVISNFIVQCLLQKDITIYGDGSQTRSFCYVSDLVKGLMLMMDGPQDVPINLGNPVEISILDIADKICKKVGGSSSIKFLDLPQDDPRKRCP